MDTKTIISTVFPMVIAILTIYLTNFFSEKSKKSEFFRSKKHEYLPHIYKEMSLIYFDMHTVLSEDEDHYMLPPKETSFENVVKYLKGIGFSDRDIKDADNFGQIIIQKQKLNLKSLLLRTRLMI